MTNAGGKLYNLPLGIYNATMEDTTYLPDRWGTLCLFKTANYGAAVFMSTFGKMYFRHFSLGNDEWFFDWTSCALKSDLRNIAYTGGINSTEFSHQLNSDYYILGMYDTTNPRNGVTLDIDYKNKQIRVYHIKNGEGTYIGKATLQQ